MLKSRVLSICLGIAALMSTGAVSAVARDAPGNEFSLSEEWKNQILADLEYNKRYLPGARIRGRFGLVRFELKMNRAGWVLPGTRIVTLDDELGRLALLLLQQSQPFPPPDQVKVPDAGFRMVVPMRFNSPPLSEENTGGPDFERRKLLECYEADRQELEYQRRKAARRKIEAPDRVYRMPEGCFEAKRREAERRRSVSGMAE